MAIIFYAKLNVSSKIYDIYSGKEKLSEILDKLYKKITDKVEYTQVFKWREKTEKGFVEKEKEEIYCFSDIKKRNVPRRYISGRVIRRYPIFTEEFDNDTRKATRIVHENNAVGINFYFDVDNEIITFWIRSNFKQVQFIEAFTNLINTCMEEIDFTIFLIPDPLSIREKIKSIYKITKIKATVIPPNVNEEHLKELYTESVRTMEEANITRKTSIFEVSDKSDKGINVKSPMIKNVLDTDEALRTYKKGYGKIEVEGQNSDGSKLYYNSEKNSPYITLIDDDIKMVEQRFIKASQKGIVILLANTMVES